MSMLLMADFHESREKALETKEELRGISHTYVGIYLLPFSCYGKQQSKINAVQENYVLLCYDAVSRFTS